MSAKRPSALPVFVGLALAIAVLVVLVFLVGPTKTVRAIAKVGPIEFGAITLLAAVWLCSWSAALYVVFGVLSVPRTIGRTLLVYAGVTFVDSVTPFAQLGGEAFAGWVVTRGTDADYETGLAAVASVDTLNFFPSTALALCGVAYFAVTATIGRELEEAAFLLGTLAILVPLVGYAGWQRRHQLEAIGVSVFVDLGKKLSRITSRMTPPDPERTRDRLHGFFDGLEQVATDRRALALGLGFSTVGWGAQAAALWVSISAIGSSVPIAIVLFAVPLAAMANATPLPGGVGGVEAVLIVILTTVASIPLASATAAVLVYRAATYALPILIGALAVASLEAKYRSGKPAS